MADCMFYLLSFPPGVTSDNFLFKFDSRHILLRGKPHGWVIRPHLRGATPLLGREWDLFLLIHAGWEDILNHYLSLAGATAINGPVSIPQDQFDHLARNIKTRAAPSTQTPPLPEEWSDGRTGRVPDRHILPPKEGPWQPGELKLYKPMAEYLSTALPEGVRDKPVSLFNLFRYRNGDRRVHDHYMQGFKEKFGPAAGAQLKFMGPVTSGLQSVGDDSGILRWEDESAWQDANLVQYDSIWHYAYMLSTEVYAELNKEKVQGLEDTCILLVSEAEVRS